MWRASGALLLGLCLALGSARADQSEDANQRLGEVEQAIAEAEQARVALDAEARAIAEELDALRARILAAEGAMRQQEANLREIALTLEALEMELLERRAALDVRRDEFALVLAALQRLARQPAEMLLAAPTSPTDTHRTAMLLASLMPELDRRAEAIAVDVRALVALQDDVDAGRAEQARALETLANERAQSAAAAVRKRELLAGVRREDAMLADQQARLAREAGSLRELLDALTRGDDIIASNPSDALVEALAATSFSAARGNLAMPVPGTIATQFGAMIDGGQASEGLVIAAISGARVVTPYDGQVVYAGPFRDYGHLLIIDHGEGYHTVLAGLVRADVVLGRWLLAGEPVGVMPVTGEGPALLYVQLRRRGAPINPLPWMTAEANEVSGG